MFFYKSCLKSIYNLQPAQRNFNLGCFFLHLRLGPGQRHSAVPSSNLFYGTLYPLFVPFRSISPILLFALSSAFRHTCLPVTKPRIGAVGFRVVFRPLRPFFVSILLPFYVK